jgi:hypothetical protein
MRSAKLATGRKKIMRVYFPDVASYSLTIRAGEFVFGRG